MNGMKELVQALEGGPGSGHFDHAGRPGEIGGSASKGVAPPYSRDVKPYDKQFDAVSKLEPRTTRRMFLELLKSHPGVVFAIRGNYVLPDGRVLDLDAVGEYAKGEIAHGRSVPIAET